MDELSSTEKKLENEGQNNSLFILIVAVLSCVISFVPVYYSRENQKDGWLLATYMNYTMDPIIREASMASLFVVLCPAFSTLLEFVPLLPSRVDDMDTQRKILRSNSSHVILTHAEKFMYILSIICLSVISYYPTIRIVDPSSESVVQSGGIFFNCSTTLQVCAILSFLAQQSRVFKWISRCVCILVSSSGIISSLALLYDPAGQYATVLFLIAAILFDIAALLYSVTCAISCFQWMKQKYGKNQRGNKVVDAANAMKCNEGQEDKVRSNDEMAKEDFKNFVIGMHMFSTFVVMVLNACWVWFTLSLSTYQLSVMFYITVAAAIVIFVTENLAHRYVIVSALHDLLDAKKNYVRYVIQIILSLGFVWFFFTSFPCPTYA